MLTTYNQVSMPPFMYGTAWKKEATSRLVELAVSAGFSAIDTANQLIHYQEALVGEAIEALRQRGIQREQLFLQTKFTSVHGQDHRTPYDASAAPAAQVRQSFESSLAHLHTDHLDSYVLHGPTVRRGLSEADWEVWGALEELFRSGRTRIIGVSNVNAGQLALLCAKASIRPMVVQNRCFAVLGWDREVRDICRAQGIVYQGFSLLTANQEFLGDPVLRAIAARTGAGTAQIIFRFAMQLGMLPLTGTTSEQHMKEDLQSDRFELTAGELEQIESIGI